MNIDNYIQKFRNLSKEKFVIPQNELRKLVNKAKEILMEESNVHPVTAPVNICGDIHGQFYDLLELFKTGGEIPNSKYVFMGDYVDRGAQSVETIQFLICLKVKYPDKITLVRGNHESRKSNKDYGFYDEVHSKYGNAAPWLMINDLFDYLPISALVEGQILCIHGGLSPSIKTIDQINTIHRFDEIPIDGPFTDMLWSDPDPSVELWGINQERGAGYVYGQQVVEKFCELNNLMMICRAHQLVMEGFQYPFKNQQLATVWSCPNYCYRCGNSAVVFQVDDNLKTSVKYFSENEMENLRLTSISKVLPYFL